MDKAAAVVAFATAAAARRGHGPRCGNLTRMTIRHSALGSAAVDCRAAHCRRARAETTIRHRSPLAAGVATRSLKSTAPDTAPGAR